MTWMRLDASFRFHRKVRRLAKRLSLSLVQMRGHLVTLWLTALEEAPDGNLSSFDADAIEEAAEWDGENGGLLNELIAVGFLDCTDSGYQLHDWMYYAESFKSAKRMADLRDAKRTLDITVRNSSEQFGTVRNSSEVFGDGRTDRQTDRQTGRTKDSSEPASPTPEPNAPPSQEVDPIVLTFPCSGPTKEWSLRRTKASEWRESYPGVDVEAELRKALQWCRDNPTKKKTARGMTAFLSRWISKAQDAGHARTNGEYRGASSPRIPPGYRPMPKE